MDLHLRAESMTQAGDDWPVLLHHLRRKAKTVVSYYMQTAKNTKQFLPFMLILSAICMLGFSASMARARQPVPR